MGSSIDQSRGSHRSHRDVLLSDSGTQGEHRNPPWLRGGDPQVKVGFGVPPQATRVAGCPWGRQVLPGGHPMQAKPWGKVWGVDHTAVATTTSQGWRLL